MPEKKFCFCSLEYTMQFIGGKWKPIILWHLGVDGTHRYSEMRRKLGDITHKMLAQQLKGLEEDGLILRKEYPQVPPKVEYSLTEEGRSLIKILREMHEWGSERMEKI
ncbi:MAG: winged helix-turn-helix transcriptional regulator [Brevinema sp.]